METDDEDRSVEGNCWNLNAHCSIERSLGWVPAMGKIANDDDDDDDATVEDWRKSRLSVHQRKNRFDFYGPTKGTAELCDMKVFYDY